MHILNLLQEALSSGIIRLIIAAILLIPFIYLITLKEATDEEELLQSDVPSRSELYQSMYNQLAKKEEMPVVQMEQSDLAV